MYQVVMIEEISLFLLLLKNNLFMKKTVESRLAEIESRNARVENDKAWETSWTRKLTIAIMTYFIIGFYIGFL